MKTQEAAKVLAAAGKRADVEALFSRHARTAATQYEQIRADDSTQEAKRWQLAVACTRRRREVDQELAEMASREVRVDRDDAANVFGVKGLEGNAASLTISRRDAADRAAAIQDREELRELLARATRSGDEVLARAVADRPHLEDAAERLWNAEQAKSNTLGVTMRLLDLMPAELSDMDFDSIQTLADSREPQEPEPTSSPPMVGMEAVGTHGALSWGA